MWYVSRSIRFLILLCLGLAMASCRFDDSLRGTIGADSGAADDQSLSASSVKKTSAAPILAASGTSSDAYYYLISIAGGWQPMTFVYDNDVYFAIPSKYTDAGSGGWHLSFAVWEPDTATASWVDGDSGTGGIQEVISKTDLDVNGFNTESFFNVRLTDDGGTLKGVVSKWFRSTNYTFLPSNSYYMTGFSATSFATISSSSLLVPTNPSTGAGGFADKGFDAADDTWQGETIRVFDVQKVGSTFYVYLTTRNNPTNDTYYISVMTTTDFISFTKPTNYLLEGYSRAEVFVYDGGYYMVAFNHSTLKYNLIPGDSPTSFDVSKATELAVGELNIGLGGWDESTSFSSLASGYEPILAGVEVVDGRVWLFYLAGGDDPAHFNAVAEFTNVPYDGPRGIGVIELVIDP